MHVTDEWLRERAGVHRSTVARWRLSKRFPPAIARLAELELNGRLELIHDHWQGWRIDPRSGELIAPGGFTYKPGELLALPIRYQLQHELERELRYRPWWVTCSKKIASWPSILLCAWSTSRRKYLSSSRTAM